MEETIERFEQEPPVEENEETSFKSCNEELACGVTSEMGFKKRYSRSEMEALRFVGVGEQREKWEEVYRGLDSGVSRELDGLSAVESKKNKKNKGGGRGGKKKEPSVTVGEVFAESTSKMLDVPNLHEVLCSEAYKISDNYLVTELVDEYESIKNEEDSSDDEYDSIRKPAFVVEGEPDFDSGPPLDGLEYLRRVRWEAAQIPKVNVAKLNLSKFGSEQTPYIPRIPEIPKCPPNLMPSKKWEEFFLAEFSEIRKAFSCLESSCDEPSLSSGNSSKQPNCKEQPKSIPTLSIVRAMDAVSRAATLRNYIDMLESMSSLSRNDCLWLFALCVAVDMPPDAETCASLRCLLRKCSIILSEKSEPDNEVAMLNILITISGKYFGQYENA
ncbi:uncharacterized protein [Typha angustifolia]|uniref:uncharacterized protein n=1 Tax=Typha angustifolia TaxID=59011 RepID=UPI003C2D8065